MTTATKYKTYSKYKPSGIDWLGDIPVGWTVKDLKYLLNRNDGGVWGEDFDDEGTPVLRSTEIDIGGNWKLDEFATRKLTSQEKQKTLLKEGDLLITKSSGSELHIGKTALVNKEIEKLECCFSNFMQRLRPKEAVSSKLLFYFFNSYIAREQYNFFSQSTTGLANLSEGLFGQIFFVKIPEAEQRLIADFLDHETAKIDEMTAKKQKMLELLKEKRQALITNAVTKGLDPKAKMKSSGIDWLGDIPEKWEIKKLKYIVKSKRGAIKTGPFGSDLTRDDYVFDEESSYAKIYTQQNIIENDLSLGDDYITENKYLELISCTLEKDDVVLTTRGTLGRSMVFTESALLGIMHPCLLRVQLDERRCLKEFFQLLIQESHYFFEQLVYISNATTIEVLYGDTLKPMQIALPSIEDQKKILKYTAQKSKSIDEMMKKVKTQIEKLQEYRQALITSAVTGKIKV